MLSAMWTPCVLISMGQVFNRDEYNIAAFVLAIHYHILNSFNNRKLLHIHHPILNMPVHLCRSSFNIFYGCLPASDEYVEPAYCM